VAASPPRRGQPRATEPFILTSVCVIVEVEANLLLDFFFAAFARRRVWAIRGTKRRSCDRVRAVGVDWVKLCASLLWRYRDACALEYVCVGLLRDGSEMRDSGGGGELEISTTNQIAKLPVKNPHLKTRKFVCISVRKNNNNSEIFGSMIKRACLPVHKNILFPFFLIFIFCVFSTSTFFYVLQSFTQFAHTNIFLNLACAVFFQKKKRKTKNERF
jgi:hypothetical protein